ncbi:MAG: hypothetical protein WAV74_20600, partial [Anaerolineae bacterium]
TSFVNARRNMQTYRAETTIAKDGTLAIKDLPFLIGDKVEIIVRSYKREQKHSPRYPLRGKPIKYTGPCWSVAEAEWEILQ